MKTCATCGESKPLTEYYKYTRSPDGYHYSCIPCRKLQNNKSNIKRKERHAIHPSKRQKGKRVRRSKKENWTGRHVERAGGKGDATISLHELYERDRAICKAAICLHPRGRHVLPKEASIGHRRPISKGGKHVWTNVQLEHLMCNMAASNKGEG